MKLDVLLVFTLIVCACAGPAREAQAPCPACAAASPPACPPTRTAGQAALPTSDSKAAFDELIIETTCRGLVGPGGPISMSVAALQLPGAPSSRLAGTTAEIAPI